MRIKALFPLILLALTGCASVENHSVSDEKQDSVYFEQVYPQNSTLVVETESTSSSDMEFISNGKEVPPQIKARFPVHMKQQQLGAFEVNTGSKTANGSYPVELMWVKDKNYLSINNEPMYEVPPKIVTVGSAVKFNVSKGNKFELVSIDGPGISERMKPLFEKMLSAMIDMKLLPEKPIKIGETYPFETTMKLPVQAGNNLNISPVMKYTLNSISEGKAYFSFDFDMSMDMTVEGSSFDMTGTGKGEMVFDTVHQYMPEETFTMDMVMDIPTPQGTLRITGVTDSKTTTRIQ